jgi:hypothetical protein
VRNIGEPTWVITFSSDKVNSEAECIALGQKTNLENIQHLGTKAPSIGVSYNNGKITLINPPKIPPTPPSEYHYY